MDDEFAKMKATIGIPEITPEEQAKAAEFLNSLDYSKKPDNATDEEWAAIQKYRSTGKVTFGEYEELDFNKVGGTLSNEDELIKNGQA